MSPVSPCLVLAEETWGSTLHVIRSLGRRGVPVLVAVAGRGAAVYRRSRHCAAARDFPVEPWSDPGEGFCTAAARWAEGRAPGGEPMPVLPLSDRLLETLHRHRDRLPDRFRPAVPDPEAAELLLDKARAFALAGDHGLAVPPWVAVSTAADVEAAAALRLPVVVRPRRWSSSGSRYFKLRVFDDAGELRRALEEWLADGAGVVVQEQVPGPDEAVEWAIFHRSYLDGRFAACTGRKWRQDAPEGGVMVWGRSEPIPEVAGMAKRLAEAAGFRGPGGLECKVHDGGRWLIELNPRLEAIHFVAARAGVDTAWMAYRELATGEAPDAPAPPTAAAGWLGGAWLTRLRRTGDWRTALADAVRFAPARGKVFAVWSWTDPAPWLALTLRLLRHVAGIGPRSATGS